MTEWLLSLDVFFLRDFFFFSLKLFLSTCKRVIMMVYYGTISTTFLSTYLAINFCHISCWHHAYTWRKKIQKVKFSEFLSHFRCHNLWLHKSTARHLLTVSCAYYSLTYVKILWDVCDAAVTRKRFLSLKAIILLAFIIGRK